MRSSSLIILGACAMITGCAAEGATTTDPPTGSVNVSQGGAQDISEFRSLVEQGKVPTLDTLDPVGFFAEHAIDQPAADCGKDICLHPSLAVAPRFNGGNWTMAFVSMNTSVDPSKLPRPPVHLVIVAEHSQYAGLVSSPFIDGATALLAGLRPEDRVSILAVSSTVQPFAIGAEPTEPGLADKLAYPGNGDPSKVALYEGIAAAQDAFDELDQGGFVGQHRVLLLTSGHATEGITDPDHIIALGEGLVRQGTAFGVIGMGEEYESKIPLALGSMGAGTYSYALDDEDLIDLLSDQGKTNLYPLATEFLLQVKAAKGYRVGRIYGTKRAWANADGATLSMPALFIGQRDGSADVGGSRRGGGGGLFIELLAEEGSGVGANAAAFQVTADWKQAGTLTPQNINTDVPNALIPGQNPDGMWWDISNGGSGKEYMMLNMYLGLRGALDFYQAGDCERSLGVVELMKTSVDAWLGKYSDTDIMDDNNLMLKLRDNIKSACEQAQTAVTPVPPSDFDGGCCFL